MAREVVGKLGKFMNSEKKKRMTLGAYAELESIRDRFNEIFEGMLEEGYRLEGRLDENRRQLDELMRVISVGRVEN